MDPLHHRMKAVIAQLNLLVGDLKGNAKILMRRRLRPSRRSAADPELSIRPTSRRICCGLRSFLRARQRWEALATQLPPTLAAIVGLPWRDETGLYNAAAVLRGGRIEAIYRKMDLPNYSVFDDKRYFEHGNAATVVEVGGVRVGALICEDIWFPRARQFAARPARKCWRSSTVRPMTPSISTVAKRRMPSG